MAARLTTYVVVAIVSATLIAGLIVGAQRDDSDGPVDLIVHNAAVYTADGDGTVAEAVAIRGNRILRVGGEREILRLQRPQTTLFDAGGGTVLPGFNDAHLHFIAGGLNLDTVNLLGAQTLDEVQWRIGSWARANPDEAWVVGRGWRYDTFQGGLPTRQLLDALVSDRPAQIFSYDGRTSWVNSAALKLARITRRTPNPVNGVIERDPATGEPTGVLKESAASLVSQLVPAPTREERARALRAAVAEAHRNGITSVQDAGGTGGDLELFAEARRAGDLRVRVYAALTLDGEFTDEDRVRLLEAARRYPDDPIFKTGAVKLELDGGIAGGTATMLDPPDYRGRAAESAMAPDDLNRLVRLIDAEGWQVMTHAAGDRAVRMALNAYEHAARSNAPPERGRRHRIEHIEQADPTDLPRFGRLGVIASMQPLLNDPGAAWSGAPLRTTGSMAAPPQRTYDAIARARARIAFGSDWPAADLSPMAGLSRAAGLTAADELSDRDWPAGQRLAVEAAIDAYTSGAAWASFDEQRKGSIAEGMLADLVVLSDDIFETPASLAAARVAMTIFDGKVVYRRERSTN